MNYQKICHVVLALMLAVCLGIPAFAVDNGAYTVDTNTYYLNPDTGVTDDGGTKNAALGEGMCRSVIYETALIEQEGDAMYLTLRILLMSNIQGFTLEVQATPGDPNSYYTVSPEIMVEDSGSDSVDMRFEIPYMGCYMRGTAYIIPMVRDVCFYLNTDTELTPYEGNDFIVTLSSDEAVTVPEESVEEEVAQEELQQELESQEPVQDQPQETVSAVEREEPTVDSSAEKSVVEDEPMVEDEPVAEDEPMVEDALEDTAQPSVEAVEEEQSHWPMVLAGAVVVAVIAVAVWKKRGAKA